MSSKFHNNHRELEHFHIDKACLANFTSGAECMKFVPNIIHHIYLSMGQNDESMYIARFLDR